MKTDPNDVVRVAAGDMVVIELYKQALVDEGIDARVLGESLEASFGTAIPRSVELWVHQSDAARARAIIRRMEEERGEKVSGHEHFPNPTSDPKPGHPGGHGPHTHYNPDPRP
ncbi:MAG: hypothetical protein JWO38_3919 [Gemmataceae bacterium]|nr:hypothetical protein [Gemmataceae bacterium]